LQAIRSPAITSFVPSAFLPKDFNPARPVVLIAGRGDYPVITAAAIRAAGVPLRLIAMDDETEPGLIASCPAAERVTLNVGQIGKMLDTLKAFGAGYALMAGQVKPKKLFHGLKPDLKAASILMGLKRRNAETIFGAIAAEIEKLGVTLLDARAFIDDQLATPGHMAGPKLPTDREYLDHGITIAREIARLDIGQGCVVRKGTVLAVEAFEGTDPMLRRAGTFKTDETLFVKVVKPAQDFRFDVPVFGLRTLETMHEAGLAAAALEAGKVIILDKPAVLQKAKALGLCLHGF
jgi:UDP-2,3-diacylglucosamine hydrolase